jgi:hypothetical protein
MPETHTSPFEIVKWEQTLIDEMEGGPALGRAEVHKIYRGDLSGTAVAGLVLCGESSYSGVERVTGTLGGRTGTFVLAHGATTGYGPEAFSPGVVVPGSGTGELTGLSGTVEFRHDNDGPSITMHYDLA